MRCRGVISRLNAYADGELTKKSRRTVKDHLDVCEACRKRLEDTCGLEVVLNDTLHVPPVPDAFAAGVLQAARKRSTPVTVPQRTSPSMILNLFRWIAQFSAPMRIAACVTVLLAVVVGWSLDGGWLAREGMRGEPAENLYGLEWFAPAPPGSIGSIYIAMADQPYEKGSGQ